MTWEQDPMAVARDALMAEWDSKSYLFPPVPLLMRVIEIVKVQRVEALLICPRWPSSLWWPLLEDLMLEPPLPLPPLRRVVETKDGAELGVYMDPLVALLISGKISSRVERIRD